MTQNPPTVPTNANKGGLRTRHIAFGIGLPIQSVGLGIMQTLCHSGLFDNPITYTTALTALIAVIDYVRNSGKN